MLGSGALHLGAASLMMPWFPIPLWAMVDATWDHPQQGRSRRQRTSGLASSLLRSASPIRRTLRVSCSPFVQSRK